MDTGEGRFIQGDDMADLQKTADKLYPNAKSVFEVGEVLKIKDSKFRVSKIDQFGIRLRLMRP